MLQQRLEQYVGISYECRTLNDNKMAKLYYTESKVGLEKNNGERLTEPLFDKIEPMYEGAPLYIGHIGRHPFIIREDDGIVIDLFQMKNMEGKSAGEEVMN